MATGSAMKEYILENERNVKIAAAVSEGWMETRNEVVADFLNRLATKVCQELGGWESDRYNAFFIDTNANLSIFKPKWKQYWVALNSSGRGERMDFGVMRQADEMKGRPFCGEVLAAVQKTHASARAKTWFEASVAMRSPAADWRSPEVLWRLHADGAFLDEVAGLLIEVARAVEPVLDGLAEKDS